VKLINFAHSEVFMAGAFAGYVVLRSGAIERLPLPEPLPSVLAWLVAFAVAALAAALLAVLIYQSIYRPILWAGRIICLVAALGMSLFLQNLFLQEAVAGASKRTWPDARAYTTFAEQPQGAALERDAYVTGLPISAGGQGGEGRLYLGQAGGPLDPAKVERARSLGKEGFYQDAPIARSARTWMIYGALAASTAVLWYLVKHTRHGKAMRAVSYNMDTARLMGVNVGLTITLTFFLGGALAGVGGVLWGLWSTRIEPLMGFFPGIKAFIAAVIGGIGSIPGAVLGGILLGYVEVIVTAYVPSDYTRYIDGLAFLALILILLGKPSGLLGRAEGEKV
jgi:branched-chain amino acid transport system permease protein